MPVFPLEVKIPQIMVMVVHLLQRGVLRRSETEFCAVRSAHASREVLDRSLSCGRSVDAIGTLQRLMSTASVLEHRAHQRRQMKLVGAHQPRSRSVPGDRTRDAIFSHRVSPRAPLSTRVVVRVDGRMAIDERDVQVHRCRHQPLLRCRARVGVG